MGKQKIVTVLGVIAAVASAILAQIDVISAKWGAIIALVGALAAASGGAITKFIESTKLVTIIGVLVAVSGVLAGAGDLIGAQYAQYAAIVGTALTAIGKSLFGWEDKGENK